MLDRESPDPYGEVLAELARMRRSNARLVVLSFVGPVVAACVAIGWSSAAGPRLAAAPQARGKAGPSIIEARGLVIRDEAGKVRATFGYEDKVSASLKLYEAGRVATEYSVPSRGMGMLTFNHPDETTALQLGGGAGADSGIDMYDTKGHNRLSIEADREGGSHFTMSRAGDRQRFQLGIRPDGVAYFDFFDDQDKAIPLLDRAGVPIGPKR